MNIAADLFRFLAGRGRLQIVDHLRRHQGPLPNINELSRRTQVPLATTWHAVHDLENLGLVFVDRVGNNAMIRLNKENPVWKRLESLLDLDLPSPHGLAYDYFVRRLRSRLPEIAAYQFGSVRHGKHRPESDVDVEVVFGDSGYDRESVRRACAEASDETLERFRITVTPIVSRHRTVTIAG